MKKKISQCIAKRIVSILVLLIACIKKSILIDIDRSVASKDNEIKNLRDGTIEFYQLMITYHFTEMRKQADVAFDRLLRSMEHVNGIQSRSNGNSMACLANNLLLIAAFMETIGFISTLFCVGEQKKESSLEDAKEDSLPFMRKRRASFLTMPDFTHAGEVDEIKEDSSIVSKPFKHIINIYDKDIHFIQDVPANVTSNIHDLIMDTIPKDVKGYL